MKVLVTGASGFIGSHLTQLLLKSGFVVHGVCYSQKIHIEHPQLTVTKKDLSRDSLGAELRAFRPDCLVHTAAINPSVKQLSLNPDFNQFNHEVTLDLVAQYLDYVTSIGQSKVSNLHKLINLSTYEIYGEASDLGHDENAKMNPLTEYAASKAITHDALESMSCSYAQLINVVCSNNYGPSQSKEKLIPAVFERLVKNQSINLYGDGSSQRTWTYVMDTCLGILEVLLRGRRNRYHLCSDEDVTVKNMVYKIHQILKDKQIIQTPKPKIQWHPSDLNPAFKMSDILSKNDLKWRAKTGLNEGLALTIDHLIETQQI